MLVDVSRDSHSWLEDRPPAQLLACSPGCGNHAVYQVLHPETQWAPRSHRRRGRGDSRAQPPVLPECSVVLAGTGRNSFLSRVEAACVTAGPHLLQRENTASLWEADLAALAKGTC